jgi:lysozyme
VDIRADLSVILSFEEGNRVFAYDDKTGIKAKAPVGKITIGIGHNLQDKGLSPAIVQAILDEDVQEATQTAVRIFGRDVLGGAGYWRSLALIHLSFWLGETRLQKFTKTIGLVKSGKWQEASEELKKSLLTVQAPKRLARVAESLSSDCPAAEWKVR